MKILYLSIIFIFLNFNSVLSQIYLSEMGYNGPTIYNTYGSADIQSTKGIGASYTFNGKYVIFAGYSKLHLNLKYDPNDGPRLDYYATEINFASIFHAKDINEKAYFSASAYLGFSHVNDGGSGVNIGNAGVSFFKTIIISDNFKWFPSISGNYSYISEIYEDGYFMVLLSVTNFLSASV